MYRFAISRDRDSYNFKKNIGSPDSWEGDHNAQYNMIDTAFLYKNNNLIWWAKTQTVANMPFARHEDTIVPGKFYIKWNIPRRLFKGHIHGIVGAFDQEGQQVDENSVQSIPGKNGAPIDWTRWIAFHSTLKNDPAPYGEETRFAWSAGCFIVSPEKQAELWLIGQEEGFTTGLLIPCELYEI